jgi:hypothetical protein
MWDVLESVKSEEGVAGLAAHKTALTKQTDMKEIKVFSRIVLLCRIDVRPLCKVYAKRNYLA